MLPLAASPILVDQVYARLLGAIEDQTLLPGQRIRQSALAETLGVSRQPVSHALQILKQQGLVQDSGRQGLEVVPMDPVALRQLYEVRSVLDGLAARLAAGRTHGPAERRRLDEVAAAGADFDAATPLAMLVQADVAFHQALHRLAGNPAIPEMVAPQWPHFRRSMGTVLAQQSYRGRAWREHAEIARLVLSGDADGAGRAAETHAVQAGIETERHLTRAEAGDSPGPEGRT